MIQFSLNKRKTFDTALNVKTKQKKSPQSRNHDAESAGAVEQPKTTFDPRGSAYGHIVHISWWQISMLIVANKLSMLTSYAPIISLPPSTKDAWMSSFIAGIAATLMAFIVYFLGSRFPGRTVFSYSETILGKWLGKALSIVIALFFIHLAGTALIQFSEMIVVTAMPLTPLVILCIILALLSIQYAVSGVEVIARFGEIVGPVMVVSILMLFGMITGYMDLGRLTPILDYGIVPVLEQALSPIAIFGEITWIILLMMPFLEKPFDAVKAILVGNGIAMLIVSLGAFALAALFDSKDLSQMTFPPYKAAQLISIADTIQRVEWLMASLWIGSMTLKVALLFYGASAGIGAVFKLKDYRWILPLTGLGSVIYSITVYKNLTQVIEYMKPYWFLPVNLPLELGIPGFLLLGAILRGKKEKQSLTLKN